MALAAKREGVKQVPWFSLTEWHQVYKQVYSNNTADQNDAYEMLLAWKARMPKLPVGLDCTLSIVQVCLRDREWTAKINNGDLPISYENDLCLMYSTTIMRFLNHISNIGHTKQTSLFRIAKELKIPEWIVNLRHDAAHGHELPSIDVLRIATNMLLTWLHEEYWAAEAKALDECYTNDLNGQRTEEVQAFSDLIELWTAVSLYIYVGYHLVSDLPDNQLQETLQDLRSYAIGLLDDEHVEESENDFVEPIDDNIRKDKKYSLTTARTVLLSEIARYLNRKSIPNKEEIVFNALLNSEAFLPSADIFSIFISKKKRDRELVDDLLPLNMVTFWKDIIFFLHESGLMEGLIFQLLRIVDADDETKHKREIASLWINSMSYSFVKLSSAQSISQTMEHQLEIAKKKLPLKTLEHRIKVEAERSNPHLKQVLWFDLSNTVPNCLTDINFVTNLILNANEFSIKFISPLLELVSPKIGEHQKQLLLELVNIYTVGRSVSDKSASNSELKKTFTVQDICKLQDLSPSDINKPRKMSEEIIPPLVGDRTIRNPDCQLAHGNYDWSSCPIGILPWQIDSVEVISPLKTVSSKHNVSSLEFEITPAIIDNKDLKMRSQINWDNVLRKTKRSKRRHEQRNADIMINRAIETAKKRK